MDNFVNKICSFLQEPLIIKSKKSNRITINGNSFTGTDITMDNDGNVIVSQQGGKSQVISTKKDKKIYIEIHGDVETVSSETGNISCVNVTNGVTNESGDIICHQVLSGNVKTESGNIECYDVYGNVKNESGNVKAANVYGKCKTESGEIKKGKL